MGYPFGGILKPCGQGRGEGGGVCFARQKNYVYRIQLQVGIPLVSHVFVIIFVPIDTNDN